jgi:hypothetical protein
MTSINKSQYTYLVMGAILVSFSIVLLLVTISGEVTNGELEPYEKDAKFVLVLISSMFAVGGIALWLYSIDMKEESKGYGMQVTAHFRNFLNSEVGLPWKECERLGKLFNKQLHDADWLELDSGKHFEQTWPALYKKEQS